MSTIGGTVSTYTGFDDPSAILMASLPNGGLQQYVWAPEGYSSFPTQDVPFNTLVVNYNTIQDTLDNIKVRSTNQTIPIFSTYNTYQVLCDSKPYTLTQEAGRYGAGNNSNPEGMFVSDLPAISLFLQCQTIRYNYKNSNTVTTVVAPNASPISTVPVSSAVPITSTSSVIAIISSPVPAPAPAPEPSPAAAPAPLPAPVALPASAPEPSPVSASEPAPISSAPLPLPTPEVTTAIPPTALMPTISTFSEVSASEEVLVANEVAESSPTVGVPIVIDFVEDTGEPVTLTVTEVSPISVQTQDTTVVLQPTIIAPIIPVSPNTSTSTTECGKYANLGSRPVQ